MSLVTSAATNSVAGEQRHCLSHLHAKREHQRQLSVDPHDADQQQ
ncbi:MAG: hypothetical protein ABIP71_03655 [Verrucomicrobiota bacterium]